MSQEETFVEKQNIGNAGEYYLASRLSAEDFIVTITLGRAEKYDMLAVNPSGKTIKISVKTRFRSDVQRFPLSKKDEVGGSEDFYYAFVRLNEFKKEPDFWIIPSKRVNELLTKSSHVYYKERMRKDGKEHVDVGLRNLWIQMNKTSRGLFPDNWEEELTKYYKNIKQLR
ncbi:MAG: hypothetical protein KatS3mg002_0551 [Candidatus Woesearchaeota archaeon]|nr:MAG: hypothetical protein KatS3mg002_0551 [Candidatus Woesearchaeota archaeon]